MFGIPYRVYLYYVAMSTYPFRALDMSTKRLLSSSLNYLPVSLAEGTVGYSTSYYTFRVGVQFLGLFYGVALSF